VFFLFLVIIKDKFALIIVPALAREALCILGHVLHDLFDETAFEFGRSGIIPTRFPFASIPSIKAGGSVSLFLLLKSSIIVLTDNS